VRRSAVVGAAAPWWATLVVSLLGCESPPPPSGDAAISVDAPRDVLLDASDAPAPADVPRATSRCTDGGVPPYPGGDALSIIDPLPDLVLQGPDGPARLSRYYTPCSEAPRLLVLRVMAAWSGPSQHHAAHTRRLLDLPDAARLDLVDVLVSAADNLPPDDPDLAAWRARYDRAPTLLVRDEPTRWRALTISTQQMPLVLLVDPRTMTFLRVLDTPDTHDLPFEISVALASLDRRMRPARVEPALHDGRLAQDAWEMVQAMAPPDRAPPDPTNAVADDARAAALGRALFFDARLSAPGTFACAHCHGPEHALADAIPQGLGIAAGDRNTPSVATAAWGQRWQFWDGRADSPWAQALGPLENPGEMGTTRLAVAQAVAGRYAAEYAALFGPLPPLDDRGRFPADGMPGAPAWDGMAADDQRAVNRLFANVGKAIAAFERTVRLSESPFDRYARGDVNALSAEARDGLRFYFEVGCQQCHHGPALSDDSFHNIHFPSGRRDGRPDQGRIEGVDPLRGSVFRADGAFSDAPATSAHLRRVTPMEAMRGQFHTPTLRNVAATGPWGHGGTFTSLRDVMQHYSDSHDRRSELSTVGELDPVLGRFHQTPIALGDLVALMQSMTATVEVP
jgi:cytochrome c peroxidase